MERYLSNFEIAVEAILANKMRSILTALGIIFGVAAVIAMLAIGNGAQQEILDQMKLVGVNNIVIQPLVEQSESDVDEDDEEVETKKFSPGLSLNDLSNITAVLPNISKVSPEIELDSYIMKSGVRRSAKLIGVEPSYFSIYNFDLEQGRVFNGIQLRHGKPVCIIGHSIKTRFFNQENPIGKQLKCGAQWLTVIGVLRERIISDVSMEKLGIRNSNLDVFMPTKTMLVRFYDPAKITKQDMESSRRLRSRNGRSVGGINQLDKIVIQVNETNELAKTAEIVQRMLTRRHNGKIDFEVSVPELLLKQQQRTKDIFNIVLGAIAGISLIVGGIGIMNIMLASVMERIKEIGLRIAIGAQKRDIIQQFLFEAVLISLSGGFIGIILGAVFAIVISNVADIPTIISVFSIVISFGVASVIGIVFGITPAKRAANQDPIKSLRYE